MVSVVLRRAFVKGRLAFELPGDEAMLGAVSREVEKCRDRHGDWVLVTLQPPKRPRTTGEGSQNHHLNGHIMQICAGTGNDYDSVKYCVKMIAVETMGYPYTELAGHILPKPERECSTDECALLIEAAHVLAAELGMILQE